MNGKIHAADVISVMLVDGHDSTRPVVAAQLGAEPDLRIAASAATGEEAIELLTVVSLDVVVVDVRLPDCDGVQLCGRIRDLRPATKCVLHANIQPSPADRLPVGVVVALKELTGIQLFQAVRQVLNSGSGFAATAGICR